MSPPPDVSTCSLVMTRLSEGPPANAAPASSRNPAKVPNARMIHLRPVSPYVDPFIAIGKNLTTDHLFSRVNLFIRERAHAERRGQGAAYRSPAGGARLHPAVDR